MKELEKNYNPAEIEPRLYEKWVQKRYFHAKNVIKWSKKKIYQYNNLQTEKVKDVMERAADAMLNEKTEKEKDCGGLSGKLEMKHVTFGYAGMEKPFIQDFNLGLPP